MKLKVILPLLAIVIAFYHLVSFLTGFFNVGAKIEFLRVSSQVTLLSYSAFFLLLPFWLRKDGN